jgi:hypothetical protein
MTTKRDVINIKYINVNVKLTELRFQQQNMREAQNLRRDTKI